MRRINAILLGSSIAALIILLIMLLLSSIVGMSVDAKKTDPATGLTAVQWEACVVDGLFFLSKYDATQGVPVAGSYVPEGAVVPAITEWYLQARPYTSGVTPYVSFTSTPSAGNNGLTSVALPLWPALLLAMVLPGIAVARNASRRWQKGGRERRKVLIAGFLALVAIGIALAAARVAHTMHESAAADDAQFDEFYHELNLFAMFLDAVASDNGGVCPYQTFPEAVAAVEHGSSEFDGKLVPVRCPAVLNGRDPWGQPIVYNWSNGGHNVSVGSLGPPGASRPMNIDLDVRKRP